MFGRRDAGPGCGFAADKSETVVRKPVVMKSAVLRVIRYFVFMKKYFYSESLLSIDPRQRRLHLANQFIVFRDQSEIGPFVGIFVVIVEFAGSVAILNKAPAFRLDCVVLVTIGHHDGAFPFALRILQKREKTLSIEVLTSRQVAEIDESGIDIDQADGTLTEPAFRHSFGRGNDQGRAGGYIPKGVLAPVLFFTEVPTMVAPQHDERVVGMFTLLQRVENTTDLSVDKTDGGEAGLNRFSPLLVGEDVGVIPSWGGEILFTGRIVDFPGEPLAEGWNVIKIAFPGGGEFDPF